MGKATQSISTLQAYMILITSVGFMNHVLIEPVLFDKAGRDAWISAIIAMFFLLLMIPVIRYIIKHTGDASLFHWFRQHAGKGTAIALYIPVIIYLYTMCWITLKDTNDWLKIAYLPETPAIVNILLIMLLCLFISYSGMRTLAIMAGIMLPFVILLGYFVMIANYKHKDYSLLLPLFEHGIQPALHGSFYAWGGLIEIILILWMKHYLSATLSKRSLLLFSLFLVGLTIGPITGAVAEFGTFEAVKQRYPAYEQWRLVQVGKYIEHLDFFSLYQWMSGAIIRISLALLLILDIVGMTKKRNKLILLTLISLSLIAISLIPLSDISLLTILTQFYMPLSVVFAVLFLLVSSLIIFTRKGKQL